MLIKVRKKSQITLPADAMSALRLTEGSLLEGILEKDYLILLPCGRNSSIVPTQKKSVYFPPAVVSHGFTMQCFGRFRLYYEGSPVPLSRKAGEFLALLACERGGPLPKRTAASLLWPDCTDIQAVNSLSHLFRRINKLPYPIPLQQDKKNIWLDMDFIYCEIYEFEELYSRSGDVDACERALSLYRGLLFYLDCFEWASQWEAYYDLRYMALLERTAMRLEKQGLSHAAQVYKDRMEQ